jgi:hypothetical protein
MHTAVTGTPLVLLRLEGLAALVAATVAYQGIGASWTAFAALLLVPDLGLLGYFAGPRVGALTYNTVHTYLGPVGVAATAYVGDAAGAWPFCLIWLAHIGMDRALGLGLKYPEAFNATHLGTVGRAATR